MDRAPQFPRLPVVGGRNAGGLAVGAAQREKPAADRPGEQRHALVPGGRARERRCGEDPQVGAGQQPGGDVPAVVGGVGRPVVDGPVRRGEADEPRVLHAVGLDGDGRPQHALRQGGGRGKLDPPQRSGDRADLGQDPRCLRPAEQVGGHPGEGPFEVVSGGLSVEPVEDRPRDLVVKPICGEHRAQPSGLPVGRHSQPGGERTGARFQAYRRTRTDHADGESDRGQVALADGTQTQHHPQRSRRQPGLVGMRYGRGVGDSGTLHRVLGGEARTEQQHPCRRQLRGCPHPRRHRRGVPRQDALEVVVAGAEVRQQVGDETCHLVLGHGEHAVHDAGGSGLHLARLLTRKEQLRDHPARVHGQFPERMPRDQAGLYAWCRFAPSVGCFAVIRAPRTPAPFPSPDAHGAASRRRACWAVESRARVDSAPWLVLRPWASRPSQQPPVVVSTSGVALSLSPRNHA